MLLRSQGDPVLYLSNPAGVSAQKTVEPSSTLLAAINKASA